MNYQDSEFKQPFALVGPYGMVQKNFVHYKIQFQVPNSNLNIYLNCILQLDKIMRLLKHHKKIFEKKDKEYTQLSGKQALHKAMKQGDVT